MSKKRRMALIASLVMGLTAGSAAAFTMTACGGTQPEVVIEDVTGVYYGEADGKECEIDLDGTFKEFALLLNGGKKQGTYTYDGSNLYLTFSDNSIVRADLIKSALDNKYVLRIEYEGTRFELGVVNKHTVNFKDGSSVLSTADVVEGKTVKQPATPSKSGQAFIGWYEDAEFTKVFDFSNTAITGEKDVYARFVEVDSSKSVYEVKFYDGDKVAATAMQTVNGKIYELPTVSKSGSTFAGWWVSAYNDAEKLTYKYDGQELSENTTLYAVWETGAPLVSVTETGISWSAKGVNNSYSLVITLPDGTVDNLGSQSGTSYEYDFNVAGEYKISVTLRGQTMTVYYGSKSLARVPLSSFVVEGNILKFDGVENAEKYLITVDCGNKSHNHTDLDLGDATQYDFSSCDMQEGGIKFTVKAVADGYVSSKSEEFSLDRRLDKVANITVDQANDCVKWDAVVNAVYYVVEIKNGDKTEKVNVSAANAANGYSLSTYSGNIEITVYPVASGYNSPESTTYTYNKLQLAAPQNLKTEGLQVSWDAVANAKGYIIKIGDKVVGEVADGTSYTLTDDQFTNGVAEISVSAKGTYDYENSQFSASVTINKRIFNAAPAYLNGKLSWGSVLDAAYYEVKVNDGEPVKVEGATTSSVVLTQKGDNQVSVRCVYKDGGNSDWNSITVQAYSVKVDKNNGEDVIELFKAPNDDFDLEDASWTGYTFNGWYETEKGNKFDAVVYPEYDLALTASYTANKYIVTLKLDNGDVFGTKEVTFGEKFELSVPESTESTKTFGGWRLEANGQGTQYSDPTGKGSREWNIASDTNLYVSWLDVFKFTLSQNGTEYSVSSGAGMKYVADIKIPAYYEGVKVTTVETGAFQGCSNLKSIQIPNTIKVVAMGTEGGNGTGSAFVGCASLEAINVYEVEGFNASLADYYSVDGVLIYKNPTTYETEIKYYPYAKQGKFTVPYGVTSIPIATFKSTNITEIEIPVSVKTIDKNAFYMCYQLTTVKFLPAGEGEEEQSLEIAADVFKSCSLLMPFTLPSRLTTLDKQNFEYCYKMTRLDVEAGGDFSSDDGVIIQTVDGVKKVYFCPKYREETYTISTPDIAVIGEAAFKGCSKLTEIVIPEWVTTIEKEAFRQCNAVKTITFKGRSDGVDLTIGEAAFYGCTGLNELVLPANLKTLEKNAFGGISALKEVTINCARDGAEYANNAFANETTGTTYVTTVNLGAEVPKMEVNGIFGGLTLETVNVDPFNPNYKAEDGVLYNSDFTEIIFYPSGKIGNFVIKDTVQVITAGVFAGKLNLTEITIGDNVTTVGEGAFKNCTNLERVIFTDGDGAAELNLEKEAFAGCKGLTELNLPTRLRVIGDGAFRQEYFSFSGIENLIIPEGVTEIGFGAFGGWNVKSLHISSTVTTIKMIEKDKEVYDNSKTYPVTSASEWYYNSAKDMVINNSNVGLFYTKKGGQIASALLEAITVAEGNANYGAFDNVLCTKNEEGDLTEILISPARNVGNDGVIELPGTITTIHDLAFYGSQYLTELKFGVGEGGSYEFGSDVFRSAVKLTKISLPNGLTSIAEGMFRGCSLIEEIVIPNTVTYIGLNAFKGCTSLNKLTFEEGGENPLELAAGDVQTSEEGSGYITTTVNTVFSGCRNLETIVLPERVEVINDYAFYNLTSLKEITIPEKVTKIGKYAFAGCSGLDKINFTGNNLKEIADYAFTNAYIYNHSQSGTNHRVKLTNLELPEGLETIGQNAFYNCYTQTLSLPASLKSIGGSAFSGCSLLTTVTFAENCQLESIGASAFSGDKNIANWDLSNCVALKTIGASAFASGTMTEFTVPATVEEMGASVFSSCANLEHVYFAANSEGLSAIADIGNNCFQSSGLVEFTFPTTSADNLALGTAIFKDCKKLTTVTLSDSITSIDGVFSLCYSVTKLIVPESNPNLKSDPNAPLILTVDASSGKATSIKLAFGPIPTDAAGTYRIPEGITEISPSAFKNQKGIKKLILPSSLMIIGEYAFENCWSLETVTFDKPNEANLETIYSQAFKNCASLSSIEFGNSIKHIGYQAFVYCKKLGAITLREGFTSLGSQAFQNSGVTSVNLPSTLVYSATASTTTTNKSTNNKYNGDQAFSGCIKLKSVTISSSWLGQGMFNGSGLEEISIPSCVTTLYGTSSSYPIFGNCLSLTKAFIDYKVTSATVGTYMFYKDSALTDVTFGPNASVAGNYMFQYCSALESIDLTGITTVGTYLFQYCSSLKEVTLDSGVSSIPTYMFSDCTALKTVDLTGVTKLDNYAFQNCTALESIDLTSVTTLGTNLFKGCSSLNDVTLGSGITSLGNYMFQGCTSLESLELPASLTYMGTYTFQYSGLKSIEIPSGVSVFGTSATATSCKVSDYVYLFDRCLNLETVTLPKGLSQMGAYIFQGCSSLKTVNYRDTDGTIVGEDGAITLSPNVKLIGNYAFAGVGVSKAVIPETVTTLGTYMFAKVNLATSLTDTTKRDFICTNLVSVEFLANVTETPTNLFNGCPALTKVVLNSKITKLGDNIFGDCTSLKTVQVYDATKSEGERITGEEGKVTLPAGLTALQSGNSATTTYAFYGSGIEEITLPAGITNLCYKATAGKEVSTANYTFQNCASLRVVNLHGSFTAIGSSAFKGCTALEEVNVLDAEGNKTTSGLTIVGNSAFVGCAKLNSIDLSKVTTLGTYAFQNCTSLTEVDLSANTNDLPNYAFTGCTALEKVTLNENVTSIGDYTFDGCSSLNDIDLSHITKFGTCSFRECGLTSINLAAVTSFAGNVFDTCELLETVTLNDELTALAKSTFRQCYALTQITLPSKMTITGDYAFIGSGLTSIVIPASMVTIETNTFNNCKDLESVTFAEGTALTAINSGAFAGCGSLTSISLPSTLTTIGGDCFLNCSSLTTLTIPASVTNIGVNAFGGATTVVVEDENEAYSSQDGVVYTKGGKLLNIPYMTVDEWVIPEGITGIAGYAFNGKNIGTLKLPASLTSLDANAFAYFSGTVDFSATTAITEIGSQVFRNYKGTAVTLPETVTSVGSNVFEGCANLTAVTLPEKLQSLGDYVFLNCTELTSVTIPEGVTALGLGVFKGCTALSRVTLPSTLETVVGNSSNYVFDGCAIENIVFPANVNKIQYCFKDCVDLLKVTFPAALTSVSNMFSGCTEITEVVLPEGLTTVAGSLFKNFSKLTTVTLPSTITSIGDNAFEGTAITKADLYEGLTSIGKSAFYGTAITELVIPSTVTSIGQKAFQHCEQLVTVTHTTGSEMLTLGYNSTSAGNGTFGFCTSLKTVKLGGNLAFGTTPAFGLEAYMFEDCTSLETVVLEEGLTKLNTGVFKGCTALKSISLPMGLTEIGANVFTNCTSLKSLTIPASVEKVNGAFVGWTSEQEVIFEVYAYDAAAFTTNWYGNDTNYTYKVVCVNPVYAETDSGKE